MTGGTRPGAGRKSELTLAYQATRRAQVEAIVTDREWAAVIRAQLREAKRGSVKAFLALVPWVMGAEPKHVTVEVDVEERVRAMAIAAGIDPEDALAEVRAILALTAET